jgi:hypothetical protein
MITGLRKKAFTALVCLLAVMVGASFSLAEFESVYCAIDQASCNSLSESPFLHHKPVIIDGLLASSANPTAIRDRRTQNTNQSTLFQRLYAPFSAVSPGYVFSRAGGGVSDHLSRPNQYIPVLFNLRI